MGGKIESRMRGEKEKTWLATKKESENAALPHATGFRIVFAIVCTRSHSLSLFLSLSVSLLHLH